MMRRYRKYKLLKNDYIWIGEDKVYRIQATRTNSASGIIKGELGGYVSDANVIPQDPCDKSWVSDNSIVNESKLSNTKVSGNSFVGYSRLNECHISGNSRITESKLSYVDVRENGEVINSFLHACDINDCSSIFSSSISGVTTYYDAKIRGGKDLCDFQIGQGAIIESSNDYSNIVFRKALRILQFHVTMYQHYNTGETVLQFDDNYKHLVTFDTLKEYLNKKCDENNDENYTKEATKFIDDIRECIEAFEKNLMISKIKAAGCDDVDESEEEE